ncbi:hypothetical protein [Kutzneria sp. 744]|uniref:hypothetical protein n=1 Tax=Kutzneria sp. (strain 744) TaxID=345341 RepID=UPI0005B8FFB9|nr:hypothetical protein [Kutzneria sp. 744]
MREITREMENMEPDGAMFDLLTGIDLDSLCTDQLVTLAILARKMKSACEWAELAVLKRVDDTTELAMAQYR